MSFCWQFVGHGNWGVPRSVAVFLPRVQNLLLGLSLTFSQANIHRFNVSDGLRGSPIKAILNCSNEIVKSSNELNLNINSLDVEQ